MTVKSPNPTDKHVGSRVRMRRMQLGMSQTDLGDALGLTFQQVQKYEKGTNRIGASRLQHVTRILQVPISFFFEGAPEIAGQTTGAHETPAPTIATDFLSTSNGLALATACAKLPNNHQRILVQLAEEMGRLLDGRKDIADRGAGVVAKGSKGLTRNGQA